MRVGDEVRTSAQGFEQGCQYCSVILRRLGNPGVRAAKPGLDLPPGASHGLRSVEDPWVRHNAEEPQQARPRQPDRSRLAQACIEPLTRCGVLVHGWHTRIDEQVGVNQNHLYCSPSAM